MAVESSSANPATPAGTASPVVGGSHWRVPTRREPLSGWGRTPVSAADVARPISGPEIDALVADVATANRTLIARGLGRSYGDPAQNAGGVVVELDRFAELSIDPSTGIVTAAAGLSLDAMLRSLVPRGWFVPVTPGTRQVTVAGMVASDVHGKNHHRDGSFGTHVTQLDMTLADGSHVSCSPQSDPELFWATVGGMGLTGVIRTVHFRAKAIETAYIVQDTDRLPNLDAAIDAMATGDHLYDYSVAWLDLTASGSSMGRSVLTRGRFATLADLPRAKQRDPFAYTRMDALEMPPIVPPGALNTLTARAFNTAWFFKAPKQRRDELVTATSFFHPLDLIDKWNRAYGPKGFLQWQIVVPDSEIELMRSIIGRLVDAHCLSFLTVLKRFGPGSGGYLSFPTQGWTLTVDVPAAARFQALLHQLDAQVVAAGGRLYLAKDSRMHASLMPAMYPQLDRFLAVKARVDPTEMFSSDQSRRLGLTTR